MLALLVGCGLRRGELLALSMRSVQLREEHWVIADLHGKAGHIRTVPIPVWVKEAVDRWTTASGISEGPIFRSINKAGKIWGDGMTPKVIWEVVKQAAQAAGIGEASTARSPTHVRPALSSCRWGARSNPVPAWPCLHSDHRALSGVQTEASVCCERQDWSGTIMPSRVRGTDYPSLGDYKRPTHLCKTGEDL